MLECLGGFTVFFEAALLPPRSHLFNGQSQFTFIAKEQGDGFRQKLRINLPTSPINHKSLQGGPRHVRTRLQESTNRNHILAHHHLLAREHKNRRGLGQAGNMTSLVKQSRPEPSSSQYQWVAGPHCYGGASVKARRLQQQCQVPAGLAQKIFSEFI